MEWFVVNHRVDIVVVTIDDLHPNVLHIDRDAETVLIQTSADSYEVRKGHWHIGDVTFGNDCYGHGWRFEPRASQFRASRKLHRIPEGTLRQKIRIDRVYVNGSHTIIA